MTKFDVVGFGALNMDKLFRVNKIATADEESYVTHITETCGGSAANTMVGLARLGDKVGFLGKVAVDQEGKKLIKDFQKEGVDTQGIKITQQGRSGTVMGFVDDQGERALYVNGGANETLDLKDLDLQYASTTSFIHLTSFVSETSFQTQKQYVQKLPPEVKLSLDPGSLYTRKGEALNSLIPQTYVLMPNQKELCLLTGRTEYKEGAKLLLEKGVKVVAVKLGEEGCYVSNGEENLLVPGFEVDVIDTTGAGDAFCAGFLHGLLQKKDLYQCGRMANFVASRCTTEMGGRKGLPYLKDLPNKKLS
ncbi:MAG: carbohydrate kinase family protein [Thermoproteota archaeon]